MPARLLLVIAIAAGCKDREPAPKPAQPVVVRPRGPARTDGPVGIASCDHLASTGPRCFAAMTPANQEASRPFFDGLADSVALWKQQLAVKDESYATAIEVICKKALEEMQRRFGALCAMVEITGSSRTTGEVGLARCDRLAATARACYAAMPVEHQQTHAMFFRAIADAMPAYRRELASASSDAITKAIAKIDQFCRDAFLDIEQRFAPLCPAVTIDRSLP
jgi:hypothetical protein